MKNFVLKWFLERSYVLLRLALSRVYVCCRRHINRPLTLFGWSWSEILSKVESCRIVTYVPRSMVQPARSFYVLSVRHTSKRRQQKWGCRDHHIRSTGWVVVDFLLLRISCLVLVLYLKRNHRTSNYQQTQHLFIGTSHLSTAFVKSIVMTMRIISCLMALCYTMTCLTDAFTVRPSTGSIGHQIQLNMVAIDTSDIKNGMTVELDGEPCKVLGFSIMKQARGAAKTTIKFKNLIRGTTIENTYRSGEKFETALIEKLDAQFTFQEGVSTF